MALQIQSLPAQGDPLFSAALRHWDRAPKHNLSGPPARKDAKRHREISIGSQNSESKDDPVFERMMKKQLSSALPLHNYYTEFRLGQGDPLLKAVMKKWPCTTVGSEDTNDLGPISTSRALSLASCRTLVDPSTGQMYWSTTAPHIMHMDNVGHLETASGSATERRFILLSNDRRFVLLHTNDESNENKDTDNDGSMEDVEL